MGKRENKKSVIKENGKKMYPLEREHYRVENGKVIIESEELASAIQDNQLSLFLDEEQGMNTGVNFLCPIY